MSAKKTGCGLLLPIHYVLFAGIVLGIIAKFFVSIDCNALPLWLASIAAGIGAAYVLFSAADCVKRGLALKADPLNDDVDIRDRAVAKELAENLGGCGPLARQARRLLAAWGAGAVGPQVARKAASQMARTNATLAAEAVAVFFICAAGAGALMCKASAACPAADGACGGCCGLCGAFAILFILVPVVACARIQRATRESGYLEGQLLARIGSDTPAAAASDFAEKAASAMDGATAKLADSQEKAAKAVEAATAKLADAQEKALAALAAAQAKSADAIAKSNTDAAASIAQGQAEVARQLDRVTALASSIENVLKLQQSVDGTLKGVAAADEFKSTLLELKRHLSESDTLLKNVTKPRTIRFVENPAD